MTRTRVALITGASVGIGRAFAAEFAHHGFDLVLVARREPLLRALAGELEQSTGTHATVVALDLAQPSAPQDLLDTLSAKGLTIDALVNNAGMRVHGSFADTAWPEQEALLQLQVSTPAHLCHSLLPGMIERGYGRVLNVVSLTALKWTSPRKTLYAGAKSFLAKLSTTLWTETRGTGVHVTALYPGLTTSEYHTLRGTRKRGYRRLPFVWMEAESVARAAYAAVMRGDATCICGAYNRLFATWLRLLPRRVAMAIGQ